MCAYVVAMATIETVPGPLTEEEWAALLAMADQWTEPDGWEV